MASKRGALRPLTSLVDPHHHHLKVEKLILHIWCCCLAAAGGPAPRHEARVPGCGGRGGVWPGHRQLGCYGGKELQIRPGWRISVAKISPLGRNADPRFPTLRIMVSTFFADIVPFGAPLTEASGVGVGGADASRSREMGGRFGPVCQ